jgi:sulfate adenylyltransferase subunit 2
VTRYRLSHLRELEAEAIHIFREVAAEFERPALLYSVGKDSSVLVHLARKAFHPGKIPFPALFVDTSFKFPEMYAHLEEYLDSIGLEHFTRTHPDGSALGMNPIDFSTQQCCAVWKTGGLLKALNDLSVDAAFGGARRDEEKSRAKERIFSFRGAEGQWDPKNQRPELWNLYNARRGPGETIRVFPLSNWTELDVWHYIHAEDIPVVSLYFARERDMIERRGILLPADPRNRPARDDVQRVLCRFRSIGCVPCTGAVRSSAATVPEIIAELLTESVSERATRTIDHDQEGSMEAKKREGYF